MSSSKAQGTSGFEAISQLPSTGGHTFSSAIPPGVDVRANVQRADIEPAGAHLTRRPRCPPTPQATKFNNACDTILTSDEPGALVEAVKYLRGILSVESNPAVDLVCSRGDVVAALCDFITEYITPAIRFEAAWAVTNIASGDSHHCAAVMQCGAHVKFVAALTSTDDINLKEQAMWGLGNIAGDSSQARDAVLGCGALQAAVRTLPQGAWPEEVPAPPVSYMRNAAWTISNMVRGKPSPPFDDRVQLAMTALARIVLDATGNAPGAAWACSGGDQELLVDALWGLSYMTSGEDARLEFFRGLSEPAGAAPGVIPAIVNLLQSPSKNVHLPALRTVGNLVTGSAADTDAVLEAGFLPIAPSLLQMRRVVQKETCWALSNITAGVAAQKDAVISCDWFVPGMYEALNSTHGDVAKEAAWAVSNLFDSCPGDIATKVMDANGHNLLLVALLRALRTSNANGAGGVAMEGLTALLNSVDGNNMLQARVKAWVKGTALAPLQRVAGMTAPDGEDAPSEFQHALAEEALMRAFPSGVVPDAPHEGEALDTTQAALDAVFAGVPAPTTAKTTGRTKARTAGTSRYSKHDDDEGVPAGPTTVFGSGGDLPDEGGPMDMDDDQSASGDDDEVPP